LISQQEAFRKKCHIGAHGTKDSKIVDRCSRPAHEELARHQPVPAEKRRDLLVNHQKNNLLAIGDSSSELNLATC